MAKVPKVAVLLAGCGHLDGAEVREAVLTLLALDQHGAAFQCLAPDDWQHHVVDHRSGHHAEGTEHIGPNPQIGAFDIETGVFPVGQ